MLIHIATGGVGLAALQVARWLGAEIFATAGSPEKRDLLRQLGVRHVMDSRSLAFADEVMELTGGKGVDVVLNSLPGKALAKGLAVLAPYGRFLEIGGRDIDEDNPLHLRPLAATCPSSRSTSTVWERSGRSPPADCWGDPAALPGRDVHAPAGNRLPCRRGGRRLPAPGPGEAHRQGRPVAPRRTRSHSPPRRSRRRSGPTART